MADIEKSEAEKLDGFLKREDQFNRDIWEIVAKGGKGSGNFGHRGRPGERGGSTTEGGGGAPAAKPAEPVAPTAPALASPSSGTTTKPETPDQAVAAMFRQRYGADGTKWPKEAKEAFLKVQFVYHEDRDPIVFKDGSKANIRTDSLGHIKVDYIKPDGTTATHSFETNPNQGGKEVNIRQAAAWLRQVHEGEIPLTSAPVLPPPKGAASPRNVPEKYEPVKSFAEAQKYAAETLGVKVSMPRGMDDATKTYLNNNINQSYTALHNAGYYIPDTVEPERMPLGATAAFTVRANAGDFETANQPGRVSFNQASPVFQRPNGLEDSILSNYKSGFYSTPDPLHVFVHEAGHMNHYVQNPGSYVGTSLHGTRQNKLTFMALKAKHPVEWTQHERKIASRVSGYAATRPGEFVAETFAGIVLGKTYSKDIMDLYNKLGGPKPVRKK